MPLPDVQQDVAFSLDHEINQEDWVESQLERLQRANPVIANLIQESILDETLHNPRGMAFIGLLVYRMLEVQDECNQLTR